ncbi:thiamine pyrophosphate-binding protein, partial [Thalassobaculum salexigens]|uniref:thiamine pyrophosphate-binding protein n=1 Tax=Thalassobaculum salexigens TaxID=455360 RepID=UPI00248DF459
MSTNPSSTEQRRNAGKIGGHILVESLRAHGADLAFAVPGESYLAVLDGLVDAPEIKTIVCRQEGGAAMMAEAYGKLTGKPGICMVTRGPGATNASAGVHIAMQDSTPMILLVGQVGREMFDREAFQELDYRRMFGQMAKWVAQIDDPARIPEYVSRAFHVATSGRPGPVVLALPETMISAETSAPSVPASNPAFPEASPGMVARTIEMLKGDPEQSSALLYLDLDQFRYLSAAYGIDGANETLTVETDNLSTSMVATEPFKLSGQYRPWDGNLDECSVWDKELSAAEVASIASGPSNLLSHSAAANLVGWWRMGDGDTFPTLTDNSTNRNIDLSYEGGYTFKTKSPVKKGTTFKLEFTNNEECYTYAFAMEEDKSSYV